MEEQRSGDTEGGEATVGVFGKLGERNLDGKGMFSKTRVWGAGGG